MSWSATGHQAQGKLLELEPRASLKHLLPLVERKSMERAQPSARYSEESIIE